MFRYLLIVLCLSWSSGIVGQNSVNADSDSGFSPDELIAFVDIYLDMKTFKSPDLSELDLNAYKVSKQRYQEILTKNLQGTPDQLSDSEQSLVGAIKNANSEFHIQKKAALLKRTEQENLSIEKYTSILDQYKSNINFQRSLKSYFETAFKNRN